MGNSQSQPSKFTPLGCLLRNLKVLGFQGDIRPKRLTYYFNTVRPQYRLDNRFQWPITKLSIIILYGTSVPSAAATESGPRSLMSSRSLLFALRFSLCESCSTSQILLAHSGPHPPNTMSPDSCLRLFFFLQPFQPQLTPSRSQSPCSRSRSSFTTSTLRPLLPPSCSRAGHLSAQPLSAASSETSAPPSTPRVPRLFPDLPRSPPDKRSEQR